jgi:dTDP-4-dehydrorhamnose 3,5-epimerase
MSEIAEFFCKPIDYYAPEYECCIAWNGPAIAIRWPAAVEPVLSAKDQQGKSLADAEHFA